VFLASHLGVWEVEHVCACVYVCVCVCLREFTLCGRSSKGEKKHVTL